MIMLWLGFAVCTSLIVYSGSKLSHYGDIIAEKTGLGRTWIGVVLMASVTSLPELVTGISSVTFAKVPDIAVGDVFGSCVFNMLILSVLDAHYPPGPISAKAQQGNVLSASFGIVLLGIACLGIFLGDRAAPVGWVGAYSLVSIGVYFLAMRMVFFYEKRQISTYLKEKAEDIRYRDVPLKKAVQQYAANAAIVIAAAVFLPNIGAGIAEATGLGQTFVGNVLIALSTSLPEVVVSIAAVRMDAIDLAIGNLFGSNIFNILILSLDDIFYLNGPLLAHAHQSNIISALSAIAMTGVAVIGLTYRAEKKPLFLAWDSVGIITIFVINLFLLFMMR